jgi:cytochrome c
MTKMSAYLFERQWAFLMRKRPNLRLLLLGMSLMLVNAPILAAGDLNHGAVIFQVCAACHSVKPGEHMTGPSLADTWGRKAGTAKDFSRYSDALKNIRIVWNETTLDQWLSNPSRFIPGNSMIFPGIPERKNREDLIGYLQAVSEGKAPEVSQSRGGMMMRSGKINLKQAPATGQVTAISHCGDTYTVTTADGKAHKAWEFNLRFKTDSSKDGPAPGKPVVVGAGMQGDRASVVFAAPDEISAFIKRSCP